MDVWMYVRRQADGPGRHALMYTSLYVGKQASQQASKQAGMLAGRQAGRYASLHARCDLQHEYPWCHQCRSASVSCQLNERRNI